jgi:Gas vesicle protein
MTQPQTAEARGHQPANLGDILERVLDRGIVIAGDIQVNLLDIELLTIKLRLLIVSVDTAKEIGIDWWEHDPWLTSRAPKPAVEQGKSTPYEIETTPVFDRSERRDDRQR